jgi:hypothetical protein
MKSLTDKELVLNNLQRLNKALKNKKFKEEREYADNGTSGVIWVLPNDMAIKVEVFDACELEE